MPHKNIFKNLFILYYLPTEKNSSITQIAAIGGERTFNSYVIPTKPISASAQKVTQLTFQNNHLLHKGKPVHAIIAEEALSSFMEYVSSFANKPILVGHNIRKFDCQVLAHNMQSFGLWSTFLESIAGFVDTIEVFRRTQPGLPSYRQEALVRTFCGETYSAHDALEDTKALAKLVNATSADITQFLFYLA